MIVVVGSSNTDIVVSNCAHLPAKGETVQGDYFIAGGGKGANQAVAAARLGHEVHFLGCFGNDDFGCRALDNLHHEKVNTENVIINASAQSGIALILVDQHGDNMIAIAPGANALLRPTHIRTHANLLRQADLVLCEMAVPLDTIAAAADIAHQGHAKVILTPAPACRLDSSFLKNIDIITPNETEAQLITGLSVLDLEEARGAACWMMDQGVGAVIITLGERGSMLCHGDNTFYAKPRRVNAVDATAAGDAFTGALAVALAEGKSLTDAMQFANCAGALATTQPGAQPSLPYRADVDALYRLLEN